jgi:competence protein ComEA
LDRKGGDYKEGIMNLGKRMMVLSLVAAVLIAFTPTVWAEESNKININTASAEQLVLLKNVGQSYAERIVQFREENGPFKTPEDITKVKGIGTKTYELNKELITID